MTKTGRFKASIPQIANPPRGGWEQGLKFDAGKPRMDLIDSGALVELAKVLEFGARKYAENNWRKGIKLSRLTAASMRHLTEIMDGQNLDEETGLQHAGHLMCCAMFLVWTIKNRPDMDDRWRPEPKAKPATRRKTNGKSST